MKIINLYLFNDGNFRILKHLFEFSFKYPFYKYTECM